MLSVAGMPGPPPRLPPSRELRGVAGGQGISGGLLCLSIRTMVQKGRVLDPAMAQGPCLTVVSTPAMTWVRRAE